MLRPVFDAPQAVDLTVGTPRVPLHSARPSCAGAVTRQGRSAAQDGATVDRASTPAGPCDVSSGRHDVSLAEVVACEQQRFSAQPIPLGTGRRPRVSAGSWQGIGKHCCRGIPSDVLLNSKGLASLLALAAPRTMPRQLSQPGFRTAPGIAADPVAVSDTGACTPFHKPPHAMKRNARPGLIPIGVGRIGRCRRSTGRCPSHRRLRTVCVELPETFVLMVPSPTRAPSLP